MTHIHILLRAGENIHHVLAFTVVVMALMQVPCGHYKAACLPWEIDFRWLDSNIAWERHDFVLGASLRKEGMMQSVKSRLRKASLVFGAVYRFSY